MVEAQRTPSNKGMIAAVSIDTKQAFCDCEGLLERFIHYSVSRLMESPSNRLTATSFISLRGMGNSRMPPGLHHDVPVIRLVLV